MRKTLVPGVSATHTHRVVTENLVSFRRPEAPPVLCSYWLLQIMESAAYEAVKKHLDPGEGSVGIGFEFQHLAPTPAGEIVKATAEVTDVSGNRITLRLEAEDARAKIAEGKHVRAVIDLERFNQRLRKR